MSSAEKNKITVKRILFSAVFAVLLIVVAMTAIRLYRVSHESPRTKLLNTSVRSDTKSIDSKLDTKDYESYQLLKLQYVEGYLDEGNVKEASRQMNSIINNVPNDKLNLNTYLTFCRLYYSTKSNLDISYCDKGLLILKNNGQVKEAKGLEKKYGIR